MSAMEYNPAKWIREQPDEKLREIFEEWQGHQRQEDSEIGVAEPSTESYEKQIMHLRSKVTGLESRVGELLSALDDAVGCWDENHCDVPEGPEVESLCVKWGYGAVLQTAAELWRRKDPTGAHTVNACRYATIRARKVLDEIAPADPDKPWAPRQARQ